MKNTVCIRIYEDTRNRLKVTAAKKGMPMTRLIDVLSKGHLTEK